MSNIQVLNAVTGYQDIIQAKNALEQSVVQIFLNIQVKLQTSCRPYIRNV